MTALIFSMSLSMMFNKTANSELEPQRDADIHLRSNRSCEFSNRASSGSFLGRRLSLDGILTAPSAAATLTSVPLV
jgi:hypothetical protein